MVSITPGRISVHEDIDLDGDVDASGGDDIYHFAFNERWQNIVIFHEDAAAGDPKKQFVHHNAGFDGNGGSSYIDNVILRDMDANTAWTATPMASWSKGSIIATTGGTTSWPC